VFVTINHLNSSQPFSGKVMSGALLWAPIGYALALP